MSAVRAAARRNRPAASPGRRAGRPAARLSRARCRGHRRKGVARCRARPGANSRTPRPRGAEVHGECSSLRPSAASSCCSGSHHGSCRQFRPRRMSSMNSATSSSSRSLSSQVRSSRSGGTASWLASRFRRRSSVKYFTVRLPWCGWMTGPFRWSETGGPAFVSAGWRRRVCGGATRRAARAVVGGRWQVIAAEARRRSPRRRDANDVEGAGRVQVVEFGGREVVMTAPRRRPATEVLWSRCGRALRVTLADRPAPAGNRRGFDQRRRHHAIPSDTPGRGLLIRGLWVRSPRGPLRSPATSPCDGWQRAGCGASAVAVHPRSAFPVRRLSRAPNASWAGSGAAAAAPA